MHGRANWWTEGVWGSESLSLSLSIHQPICLSVCVCLPVCLSPAFRLPACLAGWLSVPVCLSVCLPACLPGWLVGCLSVCLSVSLSVCLSVHLSFYPTICLFDYLSISFFLSIYYLPTFLPTYLEAIMRDSARLPSKLPSQMESGVQSWRPRQYQCVLRFFPTPCVWSIALATKKVKPSHTTCCTSHTKSPQQTWRSDAPKCTPPQEIRALTPPTCLTETCLVVLRLPRKMHLSRSSNVPRLPSFLKLLQTLTFCSLLVKCRISCACHRKWRLNVQKSIVRSFWTRSGPTQRCF